MSDMSTALRRLLRPRAIAIVGASPEPTGMGFNVLANVDRFGFAGTVHLVSRRNAEIGNRACVASIDDLPEGIDCAVLVVPAAVLRESIAACARRGIGGVVAFASGFGEQDEAGRAAQDEIAELASAANLAMLGPNCIGMINFAQGVPLTFEPVDRIVPKGPGVCVVAQSGAMSGNIRAALQGRGVSVSHSISTGNEAQVAAEDIVETMIEDPAVRLFALFIEQIRRPAHFLELARRARAVGKPIVLLHPGRGERASEAAKSHTGALAGDHAVMRAFVEREGVAVVEGLDELFDVATLLMRTPRPAPGPAALLTNSGALRGFSLDFCENLDLALPEFSAETAAELKSILPSFAAIDNPLDITAAGMQKPSLFGDSARVLLNDPGLAFLLVFAMGGGRPQQLMKWRAMRAELEASEKPVALTYLGDAYPLDPTFLSEIEDSGIPFFRSPDRALRALARVNSYARSLLAAQAGPPLPAPAFVSTTRGTIAEWRGKILFTEVGIAVPRGELARSVEEACAIADTIGYPVVLKAQADALAHKSDVGGVAVGIADEAALRVAHRFMLAKVHAVKPDLVLDGVLVEAMAPRGGLEMIVGARRDPQWGPVLLVGLGGIWAEALNDVRVLPADTPAAGIVTALRRLKGADVLEGLRGAEPRDMDAFADVAAKIGALMIANSDIVEIDVNPVNVYARGEGALALDALIVTA